MSSFPRKVLEEIVEGTNIELEKIKFDLTNLSEIIKFLGIRLAMCIDPVRGPISDYWKDKYEDDSVIVPRSAEKRYGMNSWRFRHLSSCLRLRPPPEEENDEVKVSCCLRTILSTYSE